MIFQVLCMDINEQVKSKKISSLILSMESNDIIWSEPIIKETNQLHYADNKLVVDFSNFDTTSIAVGSRFIPAYIITVKSTEYSLIEPIRMRIIDHLKEIHFSHIRILKDEVSEYIACEMYPYFYRVENKLREFIVNSLVEKIGANFFQYTVTKEIIDKVNGLKRNEPHFIGSDKVVGDVMLLYFDALGRIVYGDFSIFMTMPFCERHKRR